MANYGDRVMDSRIVWCPECNNSVYTRPGPLKEDQATEIRFCEEEHSSEHEAIFYCPPSEATYFNL